MPSASVDDLRTRVFEECGAACRDSFRAYLYATSAGAFIVDERAPHVVGICDELQAAAGAVENDQCYYVAISCPPQHGKSTCCSETFPAWYLGRNPDHRVLLVTYGADLAKDKSRQARRLMQEPEFSASFAAVELDHKSKGISDWHLAGRAGGMTAAGIGGAIVGRGANVIIIDDFCKNRQEAESPTYRDRVWDSFQNDILTRRAPIHAVIVLATPQHTDDLLGRIRAEMAKNADFPRFKTVKYPAQSDGYKSKDNPEGWLFTARFSPQFYKSTRVAIGEYAWNALYLCEPHERMGNILKTDRVDVCDSFATDDLPMVRFWDLASSQKERVKRDPDWTVGTKGALTADGADERILHAWIADVAKIRAEAPERDALIVKTAEHDGPGVVVGVEQVGAYKDAVIYLRKLLKGKAKVIGVPVSTDKVIRAQSLEPIFEAGNVHVLRAPWLDQWLSELAAFPSGAHDDQVDSLSGLYMLCTRGRVRFAPLESIVRDIKRAKGEVPTTKRTRRGDDNRPIIDVEVDVPETDGPAGARIRDRIMGDDAAWNG